MGFPRGEKANLPALLIEAPGSNVYKWLELHEAFLVFTNHRLYRLPRGCLNSI